MKLKTKHDSVGAWAKRLYFASRALMDTVLRPYDIGSTQWYVLYQLANDQARLKMLLIVPLAEEARGDGRQHCKGQDYQACRQRGKVTGVLQIQ